MSTRIIIFTTFFEEHIGYQEVQLAKILQRMNYDVLVVTTDRSNYDLHVRFEDGDFKNIIRIKKHLRIKNTFFPLENLKNKIRQFSPHIALVIHPNAGLPYFYLKDLPSTCKVISFFGDLQVKDKIGKADVRGNKIIQKYLKDRWYNKTFQRSDVIVANTNETIDILNKTSKISIDKKVIMPGLGFDPELYFLSPEVRIKSRRELNISDDQVVILTLTRVYQGKPIVEWLTPILEQMQKNPKLVYIFAGFMDTEFSRMIKNKIGSINKTNRLILFDFTTVDFNNALFNAADYSLWFIPTISIQQSMASGLPAIVPFDKTVDHLVEANFNGLYFKNFKELSEILLAITPWHTNRTTLAEYNKKFSYDSIIKQLFSRIQP